MSIDSFDMNIDMFKWINTEAILGYKFVALNRPLMEKKLEIHLIFYIIFLTN